MTKFIKVIAAVALAAIGQTVFAYNGGYENSSLTDITIGGVTYKGYGNNTVTKRTESGTTIAANAYAQCSKLTSVSLANVTSIGDAAFAYSALTSVELPATLKSMGYIAFGGCKNLSSITINSTAFMTSADEAKEPFRDCTALKTVTAKCAPPSWDFKKVFPAVTTVRCSAQNIAAWKDVGVSAVDMTAYTVKYIKNDGSGTTVKHGMQRDVSATLKTSEALKWTRAGYEFVGWTKSEKSMAVTYGGGQKVKNLAAEGETLNLYAVWAKTGATYTIKYYKNDGSGATGSFKYVRDVSTQLAKTGSQLGWSRSGYVIVGWATKEGSNEVIYGDGQQVKNVISAGGTLKLYAVWAKAGTTYTIKYYKNDGSGATGSFVYVRDVSAQLAKTGTQLGWSRSGYVIVGWATSADANAVVYGNGQKIKNLVAAGGTLKLYVVWAKAGTTYTIRYNKNDGSGATCDFTYVRDVSTQLAKTGTQLGWSRSGYVIVGWAIGADTTTVTYGDGQKVKNVAAPGATLKLYAIWAKAGTTYTIRYYKNDGSGAKLSFIYPSDVDCTLAKTGTQLGWSRAGYAVAGWSLSSSSKKVSYENGGSVMNPVKPGETLDLYIVWKANSASVAVKKDLTAVVQSSVNSTQATDPIVDLNAGFYVHGVLSDGTGTYDLLIEDPTAEESVGFVRIESETGIVCGECLVTSLYGSYVIDIDGEVIEL